MRQKQHAPAEPWIAELFSHTETIPYAQAQISTKESGEYDIKWQEFETREGFFSNREYKAGPEYILDSTPDSREWTFIKFQLDDSVHALDVLCHIEENTPAQKLVITAAAFNDQKNFCIRQRWKICPEYSRQTIILDNGCLYLLRCETSVRDDLEYIGRQLSMFSGPDSLIRGNSFRKTLSGPKLLC